MAYSNFKLRDLRKNFGLSEVTQKLFGEIKEIPLSNTLQDNLSFAKTIPLLSEKVRSEVIVMPILLEILKRNQYRFSLFSGVNLEADIASGLNGECDFILSNKPNLYDVQAPIFTLIEAKDNDIYLGISQCVAQMLGAKIFNEQDGINLPMIYGCVTTGEDWQFLKLENQIAYIDTDRYYLSNVPQILGILQHIVDLYKIEN
ncbi:MAG: hypothetical protein MUE85_00325 [Microscillaceae bacterium]|nr:hypothetical protein [Microscillaceae bacterium]